MSAYIFMLGGLVIGWQLHGCKVDRLESKILRSKDALRSAVHFLRNYQAMMDRNGEYVRQIKELKKQLAKFHQVRGAHGRWEKKA